jgi:hypothetical protein
MSKEINLSKEDIDYLLSPTAIRESTQKIYDLALKGGTHFNIHEDKLESCADFVMDVINKNYPDHDIPFHSRWGHFKVGNIDRLSKLKDYLKTDDPLEIARTKIDLVIVSVLLDAGAGKDWSYDENGNTYSRSEGLAVASLYSFLNGDFSSTKTTNCDATGLKKYNVETLKESFQVSTTNPLVGLPGRVGLINQLGTVVSDRSIFKDNRPGNIIDYLISKHGRKFEVEDILNAVLRHFGAIWPSRLSSHGVNLGDVWHYPEFGALSKDSLIAFHKLSQWLTYSLVEPMEEAGLKVTGAEKLTGLAEYRNGGLFLDFGVIELKNERFFKQAHAPDSELILEWRSLTVVLLDKIGELVQKKLKKTPSEFPLAKVLEGGTWSAGRIIAKEKRSDGSTPITLESDGTVF